jgi:hypothetical protein
MVQIRRQGSLLRIERQQQPVGCRNTADQKEGGSRRVSGKRWYMLC